MCDLLFQFPEPEILLRRTSALAHSARVCKLVRRNVEHVLSAPFSTPLYQLHSHSIKGETIAPNPARGADDKTHSCQGSYGALTCSSSFRPFSRLRLGSSSMFRSFAVGFR